MQHQTRIRWRVLALLFLVNVVSFVDRLNITVASKPMSAQLGLSDLQFGTIFSAFVLGYALCQIPAGWLGDRFGHRNVLAATLLFWSLFTALTPLAGTGSWAAVIGVVPSLWLVRLLVGVGEAAALPCSNALVGKWFPPQERGRGTGATFAGIGVGAAVTPPFVAWLMVTFGWQVSFYACAIVGVVLSAALLAYVTEEPRYHARISRAELEHIAAAGQSGAGAHSVSIPHSKTPWKRILGHRQLWVLFVSYTCGGYTLFMFFSWYFRYLTDGRSLSPLDASFFAIFPFLAMVASAPLGGWMVDRLAPRLGKTRARRTVILAGMLPCLPLLFAGTTVADNTLAVICLALAFGLITMPASCYWTTAIELLPAHAGTTAAIMNMGTTLAGVISPTLTPWIKDIYGWPAAWSVAGLFSMIAGLLWIFIRLDGTSVADELRRSAAKVGTPEVSTKN